jgi:hypothetical protein
MIEDARGMIAYFNRYLDRNSFSSVERNRARFEAFSRANKYDAFTLD